MRQKEEVFSQFYFFLFSWRISFVFLSSQLSCFLPRCLASRKIVERSIYGYKITHVKFETVAVAVFAGKIYTRALLKETPRKNEACRIDAKSSRYNRVARARSFAVLEFSGTLKFSWNLFWHFLYSLKWITWTKIVDSLNFQFLHRIF